MGHRGPANGPKETIPRCTAPRVSILMPVRDAEATLATAMRSLERQTLEDWECLLVDDGSRDASRQIAEDRASRDRRFRILPQPRRGLVAALNAGLSHCRAPLVARMDADDWSHRARLLDQASLLDRRPDLEAVGCLPRLFPRRSLRDGLRAYERWLHAQDSPERIWRERFIECPIAHPTLMIRRATLVSLGYRDRGWPEDWDLLLRLLRRGPVIGILPTRRFGWRDHPRRTSRNDDRLTLDRFGACRAWHLHRDFLRARGTYVLCGYGSTGRRLRRQLSELGHHPNTIVDVHPRRVGERIEGIPVLPVEELSAIDTDTPILASVAGAERREAIRALLDALGRREGFDYVFTA
jgi:glycosyltransferase involved in cell wall biosynthesis